MARAGNVGQAGRLPYVELARRSVVMAAALISGMTRIRKDGIPIRAIRAIRGEKSCLNWLSLARVVIVEKTCGRSREGWR
jgi:hypothetical protein